MMTTPARRERPMFAELVDWLEGEFPGSPLMRRFAGMQVMRVEEVIEEDGALVVRAEVPGIDPDRGRRDRASGDGRATSIRAERRRGERSEDGQGYRSEFRYGSFTRSATLPTGADPDDVTATYGDGILEVGVGIKPETKPEAKRIAIAKK